MVGYFCSMKPGRRADNLTILAAACQRVRRADTQNFRSDANVEPFPRLGELMQEMIPGDPSRREYRQGYTLAEAYRHWFRVKFFGRFRALYQRCITPSADRLSLICQFMNWCCLTAFRIT
jgi:hypothetical protein